MKTLSWDKIQQGDEEAFRQLYEQYADLLYGYGMKIAGLFTSLRKEKLARLLNPYPLTYVFR